MDPSQQGNGESASLLEPESLKRSAGWIRDELDPIVAREGPSSLEPDDVLTVHNLLVSIKSSPLNLEVISFSRIHLAIQAICGKATRWPNKLADEADTAVESIESSHGPLRKIKFPLFEAGGRLWNICEPQDTTKGALFRRFAAVSHELVDSSRAHKHGSLGFIAGQWWLNTMFAFRDGIIDNQCVNGGICCDDKAAFALVLRETDEIQAENPSNIVYKCRLGDTRCFRLIQVCRDGRPIRVLRSHSLASLWAPVAGVRYDGLYRAVGWRLMPVDREKQIPGKLTLRFLVDLHRCDEVSMAEVLKRPLSDEVDDYRAYKIICTEQRDWAKHNRHSGQHAMVAVAATSVDGVDESSSSLSSAQSTIPIAHPGTRVLIPDETSDLDVPSDVDWSDGSLGAPEAVGFTRRALHRLSPGTLSGRRL